jgi:para-aminobenzoate synthetase/4-amino-4-deoxychorismate lyase
VVVDDQDGTGLRPDPTLGVFDTLLVRDGAPVDLTAHVDRLTRSVLQLYDVHLDAAALAERIASDTRGLDTARVRTSYLPTSAAWEVDAVRIDEPGLQERTLVVRRVADGLGAHKWVDRRAVSDSGDADDVLLVDGSGLVLECGSATLFAVLDGAVVTAPLDGRILPGTVRARVLGLLADDGTTAAERPLTLRELGTATEVFASSSIRGVQPVVACAGVGSWAVGPVTTRLRDRLEERGGAG